MPRKYVIQLKLDELGLVIEVFRTLGIQFAGKITGDNCVLLIRGSNEQKRLEETHFKGGPNALVENIKKATAEVQTEVETKPEVLKIKKAIESPVPEE